MLLFACEKWIVRFKFMHEQNRRQIRNYVRKKIRGSSDLIFGYCPKGSLNKTSGKSEIMYEFLEWVEFMHEPFFRNRERISWKINVCLEWTHSMAWRNLATDSREPTNDTSISDLDCT